MTQSRLEVIGKQIRYFMCRDAFFAQMICVEGMLKISCLALVFSRLERGPEPLVLCPMIVNWLLNPTARFETTFSTPDTFQEQILTEIYDKTRVYWRTKAEIRFFLVDFVPFFEVSWSRRRHDQETT